MEDSRQLIPRLVRTASLEPRAFEEIEADPEATAQAGLVVALASICAGVGTMLAGNGMAGLVSGIAGSLIAWLAWSWFTYATGVLVFGGTATYAELLRTIGFAHGPLLLRLLVFLPIVGSPIAWAAGIWSLAAGIVAVRQALEFDNARAFGTVIVGWLVQMTLFFFLHGLLALFHLIG